MSSVPTGTSNNRKQGSDKDTLSNKKTKCQIYGKIPQRVCYHKKKSNAKDKETDFKTQFITVL